MKGTAGLSILVLLATAVSCGGGGSTGGVINPTPITAGFTPEQSSPGDSTVSMDGDSTSNDLVTVRVVVTGTSGIYGSAFAVVCDPGVGCNPASVEFIQTSPGTILEQGGNAPIYTASAQGVWPLVIGASRTGAAPAVDVTSTQTLLKLTFRVKAKGTFPIQILNAALIDDTRNPIPGLTWFAGSLEGE